MMFNSLEPWSIMRMLISFSASAINTAAAHDGDEGDVLFNADAVGRGGGHEVGDDDILAAF